LDLVQYQAALLRADSRLLLVNQAFARLTAGIHSMGAQDFKGLPLPNREGTRPWI
jgi:hypothetical protein